MATTDHLRLYSDRYKGIPTDLLRDLNQMFAARDTTIATLTQRVDALELENANQQAQIDDILARLLAAGIP